MSAARHRHKIAVAAAAAVVLLTSMSGQAIAWSYQQDKDSMTGNTGRMATAMSINELRLTPPYGGPQRASLHLRIHPRYGRDVILGIERGQFLCRLDGCTVLVRFDEKPPVKFAATEPADHSTTSLFIRDYNRFLHGLREAKRVRIEAPLYQNGSPMVEFDVAGLSWEKPAARASKAKMSECDARAMDLQGEDRRQYMKACLAGNYEK